jgi:hypothetical protein
MMLGDLRAELGARPVPDFDLELPPGWTRRAPDDSSRDEMLAVLKQRAMKAHKPELFAQAKVLLEESFADMQRNGVIAFFAASDPGPDTLAIPASLNASVRTGTPDATLEETIATFVRDYGARPLFDDKRILRVERERDVRVGTDTLVHHSVVYLTPMPGTGRRRALQLVAGFAREPGTPSDAPAMEGYRTLFDVCVSTLRWRRVVDV